MGILSSREGIWMGATVARPCLQVGTHVKPIGLYDLSHSLRKEAIAQIKLYLLRDFYPQVVSNKQGRGLDLRQK